MSLMPDFERDLERVADGWHRPTARLRRAVGPMVITSGVGVLAVSAVLLAAGSSDPGEREVGPAAVSRPGVAAVERDDVRAALSANFSVFRLPASPSDVPRRNRDGSAGRVDAETRRVGPTTYAEVFASPGTDSLCMLVDEARTGTGTSCNPLAQVFDHGMQISSGAAGPGSDRIVYGVVPDWVTEVVAIGPNGKTFSANPIRNGYQLRLPAGTSRGMLERADGSTVPFEIAQP